MRRQYGVEVFINTKTTSEAQTASVVINTLACSIELSPYCAPLITSQSVTREQHPTSPILRSDQTDHCPGNIEGLRLRCPLRLSSSFRRHCSKEHGPPIRSGQLEHRQTLVVLILIITLHLREACLMSVA